MKRNPSNLADRFLSRKSPSSVKILGPRDIPVDYVSGVCPRTVQPAALASSVLVRCSAGKKNITPPVFGLKRGVGFSHRPPVCAGQARLTPAMVFFPRRSTANRP
ncbi:hypothetical protein FB566_3758 [Stackebrandtia endophytica]|uniref:Uncharacterized protein n=1 Tax=Stackebrandtia endophytica TaxID=1496996 RepID=A0A543B093_9ACTN|nr:hypothetical protein FB566_3758 [Stackebrandtia endophytica]